MTGVHELTCERSLTVSFFPTESGPTSVAHRNELRAEVKLRKHFSVVGVIAKGELKSGNGKRRLSPEGSSSTQDWDQTLTIVFKVVENVGSHLIHRKVFIVVEHDHCLVFFKFRISGHFLIET